MKYDTLVNLPTGKTAVISGIEPMCSSLPRLLDMGFTKGSIIRPVWQGCNDNIRAYRIKGTLIGIRFEDARYINVFL